MCAEINAHHEQLVEVRGGLEQSRRALILYLARIPGGEVGPLRTRRAGVPEARAVVATERTAANEGSAGRALAGAH